MACNSDCFFDCTQTPRDPCPNPDISGIGVLIGYTATAGIVVLILVFHYHLAHDPTKDPFREEGASGPRNPRPNPVDVAYLSLSSRARARLRPRQTLPKSKSYPRLEAAFTNCVQSMSDIQILTGTSILISAYVQLSCGISVFHWQIIVLLAWFSSITHLSCLTFLRNYLYNRPTERAWRLFGMGLMLLMLIVATIPTGGYNTLEGPLPADYAICWLRTIPSSYDVVATLTFSTMLISVILLALGFIYRVIRLHRSLSVLIIGRGRTICSERARYSLRLLYTKMGLETSGLIFKRMFLYRPLLALFLTARALLDLWNSMFIEVLWMSGSFSWGLIKLLKTVQVESGGSRDWSFGQVVPLVLLAAPLIIIFESFFKAQQPKNTLSTALVHFHTGYSQFDHGDISSDTPLEARDHPDHDCYQESNWSNSLIYLMVTFAIAATVLLLWFSSRPNTQLISILIPTELVAKLESRNFFSYPPFYITLSIWMFIMFSLLIEDIGCAQQNVWESFAGVTRQRAIQSCRVLLFLLSFAGCFRSLFLDDQLILVCVFSTTAAIYCVLSILVCYTTIRRGNVFQ